MQASHNLFFCDLQGAHTVATHCDPHELRRDGLGGKDLTTVHRITCGCLI
jgi:hypothetical protein